MELANTYRRRLRERALDQYGFVTTRDAHDLGVPPGELPKLAKRGGLEHVAHGLYRFDDIPRTERDQFMEAVLTVGQDAFLTGDAVLALHDLGLVNPSRIRVATRKRTRRQLPNFVEAIERHDVTPDDVAVYEGIPSETVATALLHCRGAVMTERLVDAAEQALSIGLVRPSEADEILSTLEASA